MQNITKYSDRHSNTSKGSTKIIVSSVIVVLCIAAFFGYATYESSHSATSTAPATDQTDQTNNSAPNTASATNTPVADVANSSNKYKDGTYSATGSYVSPGGPDSIGVTLTLKNDIITSVTATPMPNDPMSAKYQNKFMSGYRAAVVGQDISTLQVGAVSGSSLTPEGFNDALSKIKVQAAA